MFLVRLRLLAIQPRMRRKGKQLMASTPWLLKLLTLGGYGLSVHVDGEAGYVHVHARYFWFFVQSRVIKFQQIQRVRYDYASLATSFDRFGRDHDKLERFRVALELNDSEEQVHLGSFYGEGAAGNWATFLMGDALLDWAGTQELDSRRFVEHLCALTGASLTRPPLRIKDEQGRQWRCRQCGRVVAPRPRCLYCGGEAGPAPDEP